MPRSTSSPSAASTAPRPPRSPARPGSPSRSSTTTSRPSGALWQAAVRMAFEASAQAFARRRAASCADLSTLDQMKVLARRYVRFSASHPELARIVSHESMQGGERLEWLNDETIGGNFDWFRVLYERGDHRRVDEAAAADERAVERRRVRRLRVHGPGLDVGELRRRRDRPDRGRAARRHRDRDVLPRPRRRRSSRDRRWSPTRRVRSAAEVFGPGLVDRRSGPS